MANDELKLSHQLMTSLLGSLQEHDERCENELIACQYLSAVIGFIIAQQPLSAEKKSEVLGAMTGFMGHVLETTSAQAPAAPEAGSPEDAFGIWKPGQD